MQFTIHEYFEYKQLNMPHIHTTLYLYFQCQPVDEWPLLREVHLEMGDGWIRRMIHGVAICTSGCEAYSSDSALTRLASQKEEVEYKYLSDLDIRIMCVQHRLDELKEQKQREQEETEWREREKNKKGRRDQKRIRKHEEQEEETGGKKKNK